jgi:hypothetical protein
MHTVSSCILIGSLAFVGVQEPEPSVAEELEALIAKTNALTSFHLVFQGCDNGDGGAASEDALMEFVYREPWSARCTMHSPEGGVDVLVEKSRMYFSSSGEGYGDGDWRVTDQPSSPVREALDELFPRAYALGPGPVFTIRGGKGFDLSISFSLSGRTAVFSWLVSMKHDLEHVRREGEELAWSAGALELRLSRDTGFPTAISASKEGKKFEFRLRDSTTDTNVDELLRPPEQATTDEDGVAAFASLNSAGALREAGFERLTQALDAGKRAWDAGTRADWGSFLGVLHTQALLDRNASWLEDLRESIDETAAWARATLEQGDTAERRATIQEFLEDYERKLDKGFAKSLELDFTALPEMRSKMLMPRQELFDVEREVIERLHGELVSAPIHAYFDEQLEAVLGN